MVFFGVFDPYAKTTDDFPYAFSDITNRQCWLATIPAPQLDSRGVRVDRDLVSLSVTNFMAAVSELGLNISCIECSGPRVHELGDLLSTQKGAEGVTAFANGVFDFVTKLFEGNFLQVAADRALNDAKKRCPHSPDYDPAFVKSEYEAFENATSEDSITFFVGLLIVGASLFVAVLAVVLFTKLIVRRRHRKWVSSLSSTQLQLLWKEQHKQDDKDDILNEATESMFRSEAIPSWLRWTMPIIILGNIGFFLSGHLSLGASVTIMASFGGETFKEEGFFEFSIARSTIEIWNGK